MMKKKFFAALLLAALLLLATAVGVQAASAADIAALMGGTVYYGNNETSLCAESREGAPYFVFRYPQYDEEDWEAPPVEAELAIPFSDFTFDEEGDVCTFLIESEEWPDEPDCLVTVTLQGGAVYAIEVTGMRTDQAGCWGYYTDPALPEDGSVYYPWSIGAGPEDTVSASIMDDWLIISGWGAMKDFDAPEDRPWNGAVSDITSLTVDSGLTKIGKNAFRDLGAGAEEPLTLFGFPEDITEIGESAFENVNADYLTLYEALETIGPRAFASVSLTELDIKGEPGEIAEDAFADSELKVFVREGMWPDEMRKNYGGTLTYLERYIFSYEEYYENVEDPEESGWFGSGTMELDAGDTLEYTAESWDEDFHFVRAELVEGELSGFDPENPEISSVMTGNVSMKFYYSNRKGSCRTEERSGLVEGTLRLFIAGTDFGSYTFAQAENGWTICDSEGLYIGFANKRILISSAPYAWEFADNCFSTIIRTKRENYTILDTLLGISEYKTERFYLCAGSGCFIPGTSNLMAKVTLYRTVFGEHSFSAWSMTEDHRHHTRTCGKCGEVETGDCVLDENFVCTVCGGSDPWSAFASRLYRVCLGREPGKEELDYYCWSLGQGTTGIETARQFIFSDEFRVKNYCDEHYVAALYQAMMGREAGEKEIENWTWRLRQGLTREGVFNEFALSAEFSNICRAAGIERGKAIPVTGKGTKQGGYCTVPGCTAHESVAAFATRLYNVCLDREPEQFEIDAWHYNFVHGDQTATSASRMFFFSVEFLSHEYENATYVHHLYAAMLGRAPGADEVEYWVWRLQQGEPREMVFNDFAASDEFGVICEKYGVARS